MCKINVYDKIMIENQKIGKSKKFLHKYPSKRAFTNWNSQLAKAS